MPEPKGVGSDSPHLPRGGALPIRGQEHRGSSGHARKIRILIADDHPLVREGLRAAFTRAGFRILGEAASGGETLALVQLHHPDVLVLDLRLPDTDGIQLTHAIKEVAPSTSVLIYTGHESEDTMLAALLAGASGYLTKGASSHALRDAVIAVHSGGIVADPAILKNIVRLAQRSLSPDGDAQEKVQSLTSRERQVLGLLMLGRSNSEIAAQIHFSLGTVKHTVQRIITKLDVSDRAQAAILAMRAGLDSP